MTEALEGGLNASFVVLRTPLLSFDELLAWSDGLVGKPNALAADRDLLRARVREASARPEIKEALFVASPRLAEGLASDPLDVRKSVKLERAIVRYFSRMTARSTPFGLFAGCSTGLIGEKTVLAIGPRADYRRHTRLDMEYLSSLVAELERDPDVRRALIYRPNSSIYRSGGRIRYAEARMSEGVRSHHLVAVDETDYLLATLKRASDGARFEDLARALVDDEVSYEEAEMFISELIDSQLLISNLAPPITGAEPIHGLIAQLEAHSATAKAAGMLDEVRAALEEIDARGIGGPTDSYLDLAGSLERLPVKVELNRLFQVDTIKPAPQLMIGQNVIDEVADGARVLHRISGKTFGDEALARFRSAFTERFEDREVALLEALDEEVGVGFDPSRAPSAEASPLLAGLAFPATSDERVVWGRRNDVLLRKVMTAVAEGLPEIELSTSDMDEMATEPPPLPGAVSVGIVLAARSNDDIDRGKFQLLLQGVYGPSGARLFGRFCHADPDLHRYVAGHLHDEETLQPDAVFAEIVHLPEGRLGNILLRPVLRAYEIPYLGRSGAAEDQLIAVSDLTLSVAGERVVLRSKRLGKEVIPRLTSAHNYTFRSLGVYRFLCALQTQGVTGGLAWDWGPLDGAPFLPRVRHGRVVLTRARWLVEKTELPTVSGALEPPHWAALQEWRRRRGIPRFVSLADADNELLVDWHNPLSVDGVIALLMKRQWARFVEMWPAPEDLCVRGPEGRFTSELVIPGITMSSRPAQTVGGRRPSEDTRRSFPPGSEWLYAKLYTGTATADRVIKELVLPVTTQAISTGAADSWFFVRYGDPHWHVRLRMHGPHDELASRVLSDLQARGAGLLDDGLIWKLQVDTYEREVDRYGGADAIAIAEEIFFADSDAVARIVSMLSGDAGMDARWRLALRGADLLMEDIGFPVNDKLSVVQGLRAAFGREFEVTADLKRRLGRKYRNERTNLESLLDPDREDEESLQPGLGVLAERSRRVRSAAEILRTLDTQGRLRRPVDDIVRSFIHMHANRLLRSAARAQEMVIYDLLERLYRAQIARAGG